MIYTKGHYFHLTILTILVSSPLILVTKSEVGSGVDHSIINENLTKSETIALKKFKEILNDEILYNDYMKLNRFLIRWLRDQDFDIERAKVKLVRATEWRKLNQIDSILTENFSDVTKSCGYNFDGRDKMGRPVLTASLGQCHLRKIMLGGKSGRLNRAMFYLFEQGSTLARQNTKVNGTVPKIVIIADLAGFNTREHTCLACFPFFTTMLKLYTAYYPEFVHAVHIINFPKTAHAFINTLIQFAPKKSGGEEIYFYGYDRDEWRDRLKNFMDLNQLSPRFGGTKV